MRIVICPKCKEDGLKSKSYDRGQFKTLMGVTPFYDEEGIFHLHDDNEITQGFKCSNGHSWSETYKANCWCGWPNEDVKIGY